MSSFGGTVALGYLVSFTLTMAILADLVLLPSLLLSGLPKFIRWTEKFLNFNPPPQLLIQWILTAIVWQFKYNHSLGLQFSVKKFENGFLSTTDTKEIEKDFQAV